MTPPADTCQHGHAALRLAVGLLVAWVSAWGLLPCRTKTNQEQAVASAANDVRAIGQPLTGLVLTSKCCRAPAPSAPGPSPRPGAQVLAG